ncbi:MAG: sortase, partial [Candidatus Saccharibacteria bacterium]
MHPDEPQSPAPVTPSPQPQIAPVNSTAPAHQEATGNIVRSQIDSIYDASANSAVQEQLSTYGKTHDTSPQPSEEEWKHYHSAWQNYYQTYYERYYVGHIQQARQALEAQSNLQTVAIGSGEPDTLDTDEALYDLRNRLVGNVQTAAVKVKKSRHFVPIAAAICVMLLFLFLQYNRILFANVEAYVSPGNIDPQNIIVDPNTSTTVDPSSTKLVIPKINVDVPVDYNATPAYASQMDSMTRGVAYFGIAGANSKPGQIGNTPIAGHSSNDIIDKGDYKFIFAQLEKLGKGDVIYANYQGTRYTYIVARTEVVQPTEVGKLVYPTDKPLLTLITCTPVGTARNR